MTDRRAGHVTSALMTPAIRLDAGFGPLRVNALQGVTAEPSSRSSCESCCESTLLVSRRAGAAASSVWPYCCMVTVVRWFQHLQLCSHSRGIGGIQWPMLWLLTAVHRHHDDRHLPVRQAVDGSVTLRLWQQRTVQPCNAVIPAKALHCSVGS